MAEDRLRRRLSDALDPGPDFPSGSLLSRSVAQLDREVVTRQRILTTIAVAAAAGVLVAAAGLFQLHVTLTDHSPASGAVPPRAETLVALPTLGPGDIAAMVVNGSQGRDPTLYVSGDRGQTWRRSLALGPQWVGAYVRFFDGGEGVVLADGLYRTDDGGAHWRRLALPDYPDASYRACFNTVDEGWMLGVARGGLGINQPLYYSADGGRTWALVARTDADHGFRFTETAFDPVCLGPSSAGVVTADTGGSVALHYTADGGRTWQVSDLGWPTQVALMRLPVGNAAFAPDGHAVIPVFAARGPTAFLYTSTDGGHTWRGPLTPPLPVLVGYGGPPDVGVTEAGGGWWAVDGNRLALSFDGGRSWTRHRIALPRGYRAVTASFADASHGLVVATDSPLFSTPPPGATPPPHHGIVLRTDDGGAHWRQVPVPASTGARS